MFLKPFKVKSNTAIKGSERKKLRAALGNQFPSLTQENLNCILPSKDDMSQMKLYTHGGATVLVYCNQSNPAFFEFDNGAVFPTVYTLWKFPNLLPVFSTWAPVFDKLCGGADLMLPGIVPDKCEEKCELLRKVKVGDICAVQLVGNSVPLAVGTVAVDGKNFFEEGVKGKGVHIVHLYSDLLWSQGNKDKPPVIKEETDTILQECHANSEIPASNSLSPHELRVELADVPPLEENDELLGKLSMTVNECESFDVDAGNDVEQARESTSSEHLDTTEAMSSSEQMDDLLHGCFMTALKLSGKKIELPILTSKFYRTHVLSCCPQGLQLDIKKSSYKKLSNFLRDMQASGIIQVKELTKGVESIVTIDLSNKNLRSFTLDPTFIDENVEEKPEASEECYQPPSIKEMYTVTATVLPLFQQASYSKGSALTAGEIRTILTDYVKRNDLQHAERRGEVTLDPLLAHSLLSTQEGNVPSLSWEEVHTRCMSKMQPAYSLTFPGKAPLFRKGRLEPIDLSVVQRASNKKVTLIRNLETYAIDPDKFAHQVQMGVAASTSVSAAPNKKGLQVLVQGNQVHFVANLLLGEYKIPKKYLKGLEYAPKKK